MATSRCLLPVACGLYAAALGAGRVLLTDGSEGVLALLEANRHANTAISRGRVEVCRLQWGAAADPPPAGPWQLVLGSDLTYAGAHAELAATLATLLLHSAPAGAGRGAGGGAGGGAPMPPRVILSHEHRKRPQGVQVEEWTDCDHTLQTFAEVRPPGFRCSLALTRTSTPAAARVLILLVTGLIDARPRTLTSTLPSALNQPPPSAPRLTLYRRSQLTAWSSRGSAPRPRGSARSQSMA